MDDTTPIEELCKPLSAKVMPRSTLFNQSHEPMTDEQARRRSRQAENEKFQRKKAIAERRKNNEANG